MKLSELQTKEKGVIIRVSRQGSFRKRIIEFGFIKGKTVTVVRNTPFKGPIEYEILGAEIALHRHDADLIEVVGENEPVDEIIDNSPIAERVRVCRNERCTFFFFVSYKNQLIFFML